ncbi:hypothetical protein RSAG8_01737, partial [Rhizoctonia solani AG-8 WAC10335]
MGFFSLRKSFVVKGGRTNAQPAPLWSHEPQGNLVITFTPTTPWAMFPPHVQTLDHPRIFRSYRRFLRSRCNVASGSHLLPSDHFDVWHKLTLQHHCLPFGPDEPPQCDVIRVTPPAHDNTGRLRNPWVPLFMYDETATGIQRYRAGRVRATFMPPNHLKKLYPKPLALVKLFTPFRRDTTETHGTYTTMPSLSSPSDRRIAAIPIDRFAMACPALLKHATCGYPWPPVPACSNESFIFSYLFGLHMSPDARLNENPRLRLHSRRVGAPTPELNPRYAFAMLVKVLRRDWLPEFPEKPYSAPERSWHPEDLVELIDITCQAQLQMMRNTFNLGNQYVETWFHTFYKGV